MIIKKDSCVKTYIRNVYVFNNFKIREIKTDGIKGEIEKQKVIIIGFKSLSQ